MTAAAADTVHRRARCSDRSQRVSAAAMPALPLTHPVQLYPHFAAYGDGARS